VPHFLFRVAQREFDLSRELVIGREVAWHVTRLQSQMTRDSLVYLWMDANDKAASGLYGRARIVSGGCYIDREGACRVGLKLETQYRAAVRPKALRRFASRVAILDAKTLAAIESEIAQSLH
jgi:hypothetical protein